MPELVDQLVEVIEFEADAGSEKTVIGDHNISNVLSLTDIDLIGAKKAWETSGAPGSYIRIDNATLNPLNYTSAYMINIIADIPDSNPSAACKFLANIFGTIATSQKFMIGARLDKWEVAIRSASVTVSPLTIPVGKRVVTLLYDGGVAPDSGQFYVDGAFVMNVQPGTDPCTDNVQRLTFGARSANVGIGNFQAGFGEAQFYQGGGAIPKFNASHVAELWNNGAFKIFDEASGTLKTLINVNPALDNPIPDQSTIEQSQWVYTFPEDTFSDENEDIISYSALQGDDSPLPLWLGFDGPTRTFFGTPLKADTGVVTIKVIADDGVGGTNFDTFDLTITALQRPFEDLANTVRCRFDSLIAEPLGIPTQYDNQPFEKPENSKWVRLAVRPSGTSQVDVGAQTKRYRIQGVAIASVFIPVAQGDLGALELCDSIAAVFRTVTDGRVKFRTPTVINQGRKGKEWQYDVSCPFFADNLI